MTSNKLYLKTHINIKYVGKLINNLFLEYNEDCYKSSRLLGIPKDHLYFKLQHPIVIGHMGNIMKYQENTLEGMKSLIQMNAGGMHMQVRMTRDNMLILFKDDKLYVSVCF